MHRFIQSTARCRSLATVIAALTLSACSLLAPLPTEPEVVIEPLPPVTPVEAPAPVAVIPKAPPPPPPPPPVAIVLTSSQPAYADVASELAGLFENHKIYDLSDASKPPVSVLRAINDSDSGTVVAIGLRAAKSSVAMSEKPVVFSQVFNYQDHGLLTNNSRGVSTIAPLEAQLAAWKSIDPTLSRIGAIVGDGHDELVSDAKLAAERHKITLSIHVAHSDQETLYFFKRMVRDIDGFWLFPDNRILSRRALQQIMADAERHEVAVLVPSESMLQIGASISVSSVAADIAKTITKVVQQIQAGNINRVPPITPLSEVRVRTNDAIQVADR